MRGFSGFLNQLAFMTKARTKEAMSKLRHHLQSTHDWDWTNEDTENYVKCKEWAVKESKPGVKRLVKEEGDTKSRARGSLSRCCVTPWCTATFYLCLLLTSNPDAILPCRGVCGSAVGLDRVQCLNPSDPSTSRQASVTFP